MSQPPDHFYVPREGAFAQWLSIPETNVVSVPDHVPRGMAGRTTRLRLACFTPCKQTGFDARHFGACVRRRRNWPWQRLSLTNFGVKDTVILEPNADRRAIVEQAAGHRAIEPDRLDPDIQFDIVIDAVGYASAR